MTIQSIYKLAFPLALMLVVGIAVGSMTLLHGPAAQAQDGDEASGPDPAPKPCMDARLGNFLVIEPNPPGQSHFIEKGL